MQGQGLEKFKEAQQENYQTMMQRIYEEPESDQKKKMKLAKNIVAIKKKKLGFSLGKNLNTGHNSGGIAF